MAIAPTLGQNRSSAGWNVTFDPVSGNLMAGGRVVSLSESELAALRAWVTSTAGLDSVGYDTASGTIKSEGVSVTLSQVENAAVRALLASAITRAEADAAYAGKETEDLAALAESTAVHAKNSVEALAAKAGTAEVDPVTGRIRKSASGIPTFGDQVVSCGVLGDSRAANHGYFGRTLDVKGAAVWASILSSGSIRLSPSDILGIGGTLIAQNNGAGLSALNRVGQLAGRGIDVVFTFCDINDALAGRTGEQMFSDKMALTDALLAIGVLPVHLMCVVPNTIAGNAPEKKEIAKYNRLLAARAVIDKRFVLVDTDLRFVDWATGGSVGGVSITSPYYDGLHYGPLAARALGADIVSALTARGLITNPPPFLMTGPMDLYSADAPYGNRFGSVGTLAGIGGAMKDYDDAAGSAASGVCADGCRLYKDVGNAVTVTGSKSSTTVRGATVTTQKIVISSGGTGDQLVSFALPNGVDYSAGQKYGLGAFFKFTKFSGLKEVGFFCAEYADPNYNQNYVFSNYDAGTNSEVLQSAFAAELLVPELTLSTGVSALQSRVAFRVNGATADVEVEIALPTLRLIP